ncbi:MAG: hypothetical protein H0T79_10120 [Deltaproteobacteria bacterium]|nr:hypothetical protein [Deltaproteobacteria bacterium]
MVYVHGYFTDVDRAWKGHRLAEQFAISRMNAMFIVCGAPRSPRENVDWDSLDALLASVGRELDASLPEGSVIAIGHSGAHRTLSTWLETERLATVVLIDALYGEQPEFKRWIEADPARRLIDVGDLTRPWTDDLHAALPETLVFDAFPPRAVGRLSGARTARIVYVRSTIGHMALVTDGIALPMLLGALRLPLVPATPSIEPLE